MSSPAGAVVAPVRKCGILTARPSVLLRTVFYSGTEGFAWRLSR